MRSFGAFWKILHNFLRFLLKIVHCFCRTFATRIPLNDTSMDQKSQNDKQDRRHQAASSYTEEQTRLLFAMRDMVKAEVERQLKELFKKY